MNKKKKQITDNLDILSSIWILACNDDIPQISYKGIQHRLGIPPEIDIKALVHSRGELFRKRTQLTHLNVWKEEMLRGVHLPTWLRDIKDESERKEKINNLTTEDIFRSQFRTEVDSPKSSLQIMNWGLEHIDRLRKAELESNRERTRTFTTVVLPLLSTLIAIIAVISSFYVQYTSNKSQTSLKQYEVEFKPKQEGYSNFMSYLIQAYFSAAKGNSEQMVMLFDKIEGCYYNLEPFLSKNDRDQIWNQFQQFQGLCDSMIKSQGKDNHQTAELFLEFKNFFREHLYSALFPSQEKP